MSSDAERAPRPVGNGRPPAETVELPAPTVWPVVTALGITLAFAGMVTAAAIGAVGLVLAAVGGVGWWRAVLPVEAHEAVPLRPPELRARPIEADRRAVEHLQVGVAGHRQRLPVAVTPFSAGIAGGIVGGLAMAVVACLYGVLDQGSLWYPINLAAGVVRPTVGAAGAAGLREFSAVNLVVGIVVHGAVSVLMGLLYAVILPMLPGRVVLWGGLVAPLMWSGLIWSFLGIINPALNLKVDWVWFVASQIAFGLAAGVVVSRIAKIPTMQAWSLRARAGVEAPGLEREERDAGADEPGDGEPR